MPRRGFIHRLATIPTPVIFLGSIAIAVIVLWRSGDVGSVVDSLRHADPALLVLGAILYLVGLFLLCIRWHSLVLMIHAGLAEGREGSHVMQIRGCVQHIVVHRHLIGGCELFRQLVHP